MSSTLHAVKITPLTPTFGARVDGLNAKEPLPEEVVDQLKQAILDYKVLFLTAQHLDEAQHARLAAYFRAPFKGSNRFDQEYEQSGLTNVKVVAHFHSDLMYREEQPAFAMLQMLQLPSVGGDTMWADLGASYEALSDPVKELLEGLYAYHVHPDYYLSDEERSRRYEAGFGRPLTSQELSEQKEALSPNIHPLVRQLPETGRKYYFASAQHTARLQGLSRDESDALLNLIFKQQLQPEFVIRWNWTLGDIAFWDHRTTLHAGVNDYSRSETRRGRRANIGTSNPIPAS
ncbi:MAG TPA: TauD/TfdA family dioxygenase [Streptosporangiaceae bacterium]|nr:TauD/TfdA family dioxygenase [Streptosporangiaceae bacterium]